MAVRTGTTASWTSVRENPSGVFFKRSDIRRSVTYKNIGKTMPGICGTLVIRRLGALAALLTLPCSRVWSKDGPSCKVKWAAALYTEASRAVCQEPVSALSNLFPVWEEHTFYIPDAFTQDKSTQFTHKLGSLLQYIFSTDCVCIPFWGTAGGHWRRVHRAGRLHVLSPMKRERVGEQGCQQGETLNLQVSFHSLASLAPWK